MIVGLLRIKNVEKWIGRLLIQLCKICDKVLILDDGSTDDTYWKGILFNNAIFSKEGNKIEIQGQTLPFHGGRDRIMLHQWAAEYSPTWIVALDGDELFEEGKEEEVRNLMLKSDDYVEAWTFPFFYLWGDEEHYRTDGSYSNVKAIRIFRYNKDELPENKSSHSVALPVAIRERSRIYECSNIKIVHFGYMDKEERVVRYNYYSSRDKDPLKAGAGDKNYNHIISNKAELALLKDWNINPKLKIAIAPEPIVGGYEWLDIKTDVNLTRYEKKSVDECYIKELSLLNLNTSEMKIVFRMLHDIMKTLAPLKIYDNNIKNFEELKLALELSYFGSVKNIGKNGETYVIAMNGA